MNQPTIEQYLIKKFEELLAFTILTLTESKDILTTRFTKQLNELQILGCSEREISLVKDIQRIRIQNIDNEIIETQNELRVLKQG